ncbi:unnamed protein product [Effrenium voratum]|nr:unnamed protein product [Effrenium voratum]
MVQKARPAELSSQVQHAELAWTFLLGFTRAQVSPSVSALLANPDWRSAYDSSRVVRERGAKLHLEPDWARLENIVCSKGFKEAISEFSSLRQAVLRSSPIQLAGMVAQARVAWLFLVGFGEKRRLFQSQLAEVVRVLRKESGWRSSLEELRPELQSGIAALPESLQTAFGAEGENARPGGLRAAEDDLETVVRGVEAQLTAPDVDASDSKAKERVMREIKEACTRVRSGHKAEENRERSTLVEAKDEEGIYWVKLLNEARLGCAPPQSSQAWQKVIGDWSQSHEARLARAREQAKNAEALAQQAAEKCDKLKKEYEDKSRAKAGIDAKLKLQQETLQLSAEEAALRHREAEELSASGGPVKQLRDILVGGNVVWVWVEDGNRAASHPEDRRNPEIDNGILYPQDVWAEIEARWLLWQHNGLQHSFSVDVGTKLFAQETGSLYSITLHAQRPFQENARTGTRRNIFRVKLGEARTARLQAELEQQRRLTAEELVKAEEQLAAQLRASACLLLAAELINGQALELHQGLQGIPDDFSIQFPQGELVGKAQIPVAWEDMGGKLYAEVELSRGSLEFQKLEAYFQRTTPERVLRIKRIQNTPLWFLYQHRRAAVASKPQNNGFPNEELFFHGAKQPGITSKILMSGFDARFGGRLWFATNSAYSRAFCCRQEAPRMIVARLTLGYISRDCCHCGRTSEGHMRRDKDYGGGQDERYTIEDDCQTYPAYIIEFG